MDARSLKLLCFRSLIKSGHKFNKSRIPIDILEEFEKYECRERKIKLMEKILVKHHSDIYYSCFWNVMFKERYQFTFKTVDSKKYVRIS